MPGVGTLPARLQKSPLFSGFSVRFNPRQSSVAELLAVPLDRHIATRNNQ
jgi:hypothetical protein